MYNNILVLFIEHISNRYVIKNFIVVITPDGRLISSENTTETQQVTLDIQTDDKQNVSSQLDLDLHSDESLEED